MTEELGVRHASLKLCAARVQAAGWMSDETEYDVAAQPSARDVSWGAKVMREVGGGGGGG